MLRFFVNGSFLYNVGDAEHLGKATVCTVGLSESVPCPETTSANVCGFPWTQTCQSHQGGVTGLQMNDVERLIINYILFMTLCATSDCNFNFC